MTQQPCDRIFVCDGLRTLAWQACDDWDRTTMLACLASDPHSFDELALAWSQYRPGQPLMELEWHEISSRRGANLHRGEWLAIDLANQRYAWRDPEDIAAAPGCYEPDDVNVDGRNPLVWINVPPWWNEVAPQQWSFAAGASEAEPILRAARRSPLDFRSVLYGRPLVKYIAEQVVAGRFVGDRGGASKGGLVERVQDESPAAAAEAAGARDGFTPQERAQVQRWEKLTKQIHGRWLMTPRAELGDKRPRKFLHAGRQWKDRELDHRRSQWSRERRPPPPVPRTSDLFRFGPMGTEEVLSYFDLCRQLISAALQWVDDESQLACSELIERLEQVREGYLASEALEGDGLTVQEVIDGERQLVPRVASSDPIDCDCPLCRLHGLEPEMFGPAFTMSDGFREDMEEEFAFSLHAKREDWEQARDEWLSWSDATVAELDSAKEHGERGSQDSIDVELRRRQAVPLEAVDGDWAQVWQASYSDMSQGDPRLSLLGIGAHLGEIIADLKEMAAAREEIEQLNRAFDELGRSIRRWLAGESTDAPIGDSSCAEPAAGEMIQRLEALVLKHPELTAKSADLQSRIHQWQRQLLPSQGG